MSFPPFLRHILDQSPSPERVIVEEILGFSGQGDGRAAYHAPVLSTLLNELTLDLNHGKCSAQRVVICPHSAGSSLVHSHRLSKPRPRGGGRG